MFRFLAGVAHMSEMETDTGELHVVSPVHTTSPVGKLCFSPEKNQRIHVGNVHIVIPFCCCNEPSSSPFEMLNQNVFNFWDGPAVI